MNIDQAKQLKPGNRVKYIGVQDNDVYHSVVLSINGHASLEPDVFIWVYCRTLGSNHYMPSTDLELE
jgi:hypothetical protein